MPLSERFFDAIHRFDEENSKDPTHIEHGGKTYSRELHYAQRLTEWVKRLQPNPSEELLLAARCQHICRWMIPRNTYEMNRVGYLKWRNDLKKFHAEKAGAILSEIGYPDDFIVKVQDLNLKKHLTTDPQSQTLEDALCLVFLEDQFAEFATRTDREKTIGILQKTWAKMSEQGRAEALKLPLEDSAKQLIQEALTDI
jgi:hypothetical protein